MVYVLVVLVLDYKVLLVCVFIVSGASAAWQSNGQSMAGAQAQAALDPTMETEKQVHYGSEAARAAEWEGKSTTMSYDKVPITSGWF